MDICLYCGGTVGYTHILGDLEMPDEAGYLPGNIVIVLQLLFK